MISLTRVETLAGELGGPGATTGSGITRSHSSASMVSLASHASLPMSTDGEGEGESRKTRNRKRVHRKATQTVKNYVISSTSGEEEGPRREEGVGGFFA